MLKIAILNTYRSAETSPVISHVVVTEILTLHICDKKTQNASEGECKTLVLTSGCDNHLSKLLKILIIFKI
jgi:hypothetical protein